MQTIPVIAVAAWSGTGKTTLLERLIPVLKERGLRVCVMKHDAHEFEVDRVGKDSWRMTRAGADVTILTNGAMRLFWKTGRDSGSVAGAGT